MEENGILSIINAFVKPTFNADNSSTEYVSRINEISTGNAACVVILPIHSTMDTQQMQVLANVINLSETTFVQELQASISNQINYSIRWFTPTNEVDLCGHATLAAARSVMDFHRIEMNSSVNTITFHSSNKGNLNVTCDNSTYFWLHFPILSFSPLDSIPDHLCTGLSIDSSDIIRCLTSEFDLIVHVKSQLILESIQLNSDELLFISDSVTSRGIIVTAVSSETEFDFVSRFFAPKVGILEDPVTGSAHCVLVPYWHSILKKVSLNSSLPEYHAHQISKRGGWLNIKLDESNNAVQIGGQTAVIFSNASIPLAKQETI
mmetsp:Transcript_9575/g.17250  ORF Transcript_9575/g.17250 Transcript_9575/m.17250 type:complete len:320 (-) Transcript_9575:59-1018(-)